MTSMTSMTNLDGLEEGLAGLQVALDQKGYHAAKARRLALGNGVVDMALKPRVHDLTGG
jgi:hypothetical protein